MDEYLRNKQKAQLLIEDEFQSPSSTRTRGLLYICILYLPSVILEEAVDGSESDSFGRGPGYPPIPIGRFISSRGEDPPDRR